MIRPPPHGQKPVPAHFLVQQVDKKPSDNIGLACLDQLLKMLQKPSRPMGAVVVRPWLTFLNEAVAD